MIREVDLVSYLPPFLAEYREIREALAAEDPEFQIFWEAVNRALCNVFIATADEYGISRFEKMLGLLPSREDPLEVRRTAVLLKFNANNKYTIRILRKVIATAAGKENYDTWVIPEEYIVTVQILNRDVRLVRSLYHAIFPMIPANMRLLYYGRYVEKCEVFIKHRVSIHFRTSFYPRFNLPPLYLDDRWSLDGGRSLDGYDSAGAIDLYPVTIKIRSAVPVHEGQAGRIRITARAREKIQTSLAVRISQKVEQKAEIKTCVSIRFSAACPISNQAAVHQENYLDDEWVLDGSRDLDGDTYRI